MAVYKTKSKKWKAKINYRDSNGVVRTKEKTFNKKIDASNYDREFRKTVNKNVSEGIKYRDIFEECLLINSSKVLPRSIQDKRSNAIQYWENLFDKKYISITKKDYLAIWVKITSADKSYATKNKAIKYLKSVAKYAYLYYDFPDNAKHLQLIDATSDEIKDTITWSQNEFNSFINYVDNKTYKALFTFYYDSGATLSEALAIKKEDYANNKVSIIDLLEDKSTHKRLKNRFRRRTITLAPKTLKLLEPLLLIEGDYLFGGIEPLSPRTVPRKLQYYMNIANSRIVAKGMPKLPRITIHGFRHSHATNLINNGVNIVAVSKRLGHSNIQTTLNTYTHLLDKNESELINVLQEL